MANQMVNYILDNKQDTPVVWVNLDNDQIKNGYGVILLEKSEVALPALFDELMRLRQEQ